ncbi:hypothetical protein [Pseudomonas aeruginosa]|uniref:hypothetical protein n=1 Tax=Pseudomonas aeruginosa TaxID=287 RepID=UPI002358A244|nr:hypothetical protein [Pseudomonas aeruginosa]
MSEVCAKHVKTPAFIYGACIGCELEGLRAEAQALREEVAEYEALCNRQAELLSQSIVAIRGPEPELTRWGYADLPLRVKTIVEEVAALRARVAVVPDGYALVPVEPTREMFIAINKEDDKAYAGGCHHGAQFEWLWAAAIEAAPRPNGLTVSESALDTLRKAASGEVKHLNNGLCPDDLEGRETRDPNCSVCRALIDTEKSK